jgi:hypothetical protein
MELSAELDEARGILIVHVRGEYRRPDDGFEAQRFVIDTYPEYRCRRVLLDLTEAEVIPGTMPTFETANPEPEVARELRRFRFAAVYSVITKDERFFEDAAVNRGQVVRAFENVDTAVQWLRSS